MSGCPSVADSCEVLGEHYKFASARERISEFCKESPDEAEVLLEIHRNLRKQFPEEALYLKVMQDEDGQAVETSELGVFVITDLGADAATDRLDAFDKWWLDRVSKRISVHVAFGLDGIV